MTYSEKDYVFWAEGLDVLALRTGRLGQNVVTFEPKIRVFWPEISVPFCGEEGLVIKNACVRICPSLRVRACATPRQASASEGGSTVKAQKSHCSLSNTYKSMTGMTGRLYDFLQKKKEVFIIDSSQCINVCTRPVNPVINNNKY